nr:hypothetical protein [uncultured Sphingomonas sp.]
MTPEQEKQVFIVFAVTRLIGLAMFFLGVAIAFTDLVEPGGSPMIGGLLAVFGVLDAVLAPQLIRRAMERQMAKK